MAHASYEESIKKVYRGLWLLAGVTLAEVILSLIGKGWLFHGLGLYRYSFFIYAIGAGLIALSLYKAYFIIYEFMHMRYEVSGLAASVLLPMTLLIWAIIAFFQEGNSWKERRELIEERNEAEVERVEDVQGMRQQVPDDTYRPTQG